MGWEGERVGIGVGRRGSGDRQEWKGRGSGDRRGKGGEWGKIRGSGVGGAEWIGVSGRGDGDRGQSVGWEGNRVGIDRGSGVGGERKGIDRGIGVGRDSGDIQVEEWGGRGREWG